MFSLLSILGISFAIDSPIGVVIICVAIIGLFYGALSFVVEKLILPIMKVPTEERDSHILSKIIFWLTLLLAAVLILIGVLPAFGINIF